MSENTRKKELPDKLAICFNGDQTDLVGIAVLKEEMVRQFDQGDVFTIFPVFTQMPGQPRTLIGLDISRIPAIAARDIPESKKE